MSSYIPPGPNPYGSPLQPGTPYPAPPSSLPGFPKTMFIIDLVFCTLRIFMVLLGLVGYLAIKQQQPNSPLLTTMPLELLAGTAIFLTGIPASTGMLMRQSWGVILAALCALATVASLGIAIWQVVLMADIQAPPGSPQRIGMFIGGGVTGIIRLGLLAAYGAAVAQFANWLRSRPRPAGA